MAEWLELDCSEPTVAGWLDTGVPTMAKNGRMEDIWERVHERKRVDVRQSSWRKVEICGGWNLSGIPFV